MRVTENFKPKNKKSEERDINLSDKCKEHKRVFT